MDEKEMNGHAIVLLSVSPPCHTHTHVYRSAPHPIITALRGDYMECNDNGGTQPAITKDGAAIGGRMNSVTPHSTRCPRGSPILRRLLLLLSLATRHRLPGAGVTWKTIPPEPQPIGSAPRGVPYSKESCDPSAALHTDKELRRLGVLVNDCQQCLTFRGSQPGILDKLAQY